MAKLETQIHIRKMLKPSIPTPNHLQSLNLSLFDQLAPPMYISMLFYYLPSELDRETSVEKCAKLQKSLADTLAKFYPLAGRFKKDDLSIHCNDEGVEYVETKVKADLVEFLHEGLKIELLDDLLPWSVPPKTDLPSSPLLGIQVNIFNCGGLVIGVQISHILADSFTLATFLNEWAHTSLTGSTKDNCIPSFAHLSSLFPARMVSGPQQRSPFFSSTGTKIVTRNFIFDALAITKLKDKLIHSSTTAATLQKLPSRVVVVASLIWKVLFGISSTKFGPDSVDSCLSLNVNIRGKSKAQSLEHAVGNFWMTEIVTLEVKQPRKELKDFVDALGTAIRDTSVRIGNTSIEDIPSVFVKSRTKFDDKLRQRDMIDIHGCTSWCRFPFYEADFGWGKPFWVSSVSQPVEVICLIDTKDGGGIEAWVSLKENDMAEFERDPDILKFCPPLRD